MNDAPVSIWVHGSLPEGVEHLLERLRRTPGVVRVAVMPDVHLAGEFCVGTVVASDQFLFPNAVGGDIGCGMLALQFAGSADALRDPQLAARLLGALCETCPARRHHRKTAHDMPPEIRATPLADTRLEAFKNGQECQGQLGTLGAGNHFLELQTDDLGQLWLMIHTGSRHLGQQILSHYLPQARRLDTGIMAIEAASETGRNYLHDVQIARTWARANRRLLTLNAARAIERILGITPLMETLFDCDHNHLTAEVHANRPLWVHRKGATAAGAGVAGIVPGSMGTASFHTLGRGCPASLSSSSHGAGRTLSRAQARQRLTISTLRQQLRGVWYDARLERTLLEEAPAAYKDVDSVMHAQHELTQVTRRLKPLLVHKGT